jgi:hypothetical protein
MIIDIMIFVMLMLIIAGILVAYGATVYNLGKTEGLKMGRIDVLASDYSKTFGVSYEDAIEIVTPLVP